MKMLLTSNGLSTLAIKTSFLKLLPRQPQQIKLLYIPTAAKALGNYSTEIDENLPKLHSIGIRDITVADFADIDREKLRTVLNQVQAVWICGGNTFYLLEWARRSGFIELAPKMIDLGLIYVGVSGGSILAGPDIKICEIQDHRENTIGCKNMKALNLVNFGIYPHYSPTWKTALHDIQKRVSYELIPLRDDQAIMIDHSKSSSLEEFTQDNLSVKNGYSYKII